MKKDYMWNTLATTTFSLASLLLNIYVINIIGKVEGGIFTFGFTVFAAQILTVAGFGTKTIHIIDVTRKYSFKEYKIHRYFTVLLSIVIGLTYLLFLFCNGKYDLYKMIIIFVLMFHGIIEGYFDVYEAEYQRQNMLYKGARILFLRTVSFLFTFVILLYITKNLLITSIVSIIVKFIVGYIFASLKSKNDFIKEEDKNTNLLDTLKNITIDVLPLFFMVFIDNYIYTANKFAIDIYLTDVYQGYYSFLFLPANALYLLQYLISRPLLTPLSKLYNNDFDGYKKRQKNIILASIVVCISMMVAGFLLSNVYLYIVNFITNNIYLDISSNARLILFFILLGGMFYAFYVMIYYMLVIEDMKKYMVFIYIYVTVFALIVSVLLTKNFGMLGASISYFITMAVLSISLLFLHLYAIRKKSNEYK